MSREHRVSEDDFERINGDWVLYCLYHDCLAYWRDRDRNLVVQLFRSHAAIMHPED